MRPAPEAAAPDRVARGASGAIFAAALLAGLGVVLGAFGAHALDGRVAEARLATFETGVRYQIYHALGLALVGLLGRQQGLSFARGAAWCFGLGILLFSGSLYLLVLTDTPALGMVTPFGGVAFIAGWGLLAVGAWRDRSAH